MLKNENPFGNPEDHEALAIEKFNSIKNFLEKYDSIKLISHLSLTHLFYLGGEFKPDYDDIHKWALWVEFIVGLLTRSERIENNSFIDGTVLNTLEKLLQDYFDAVEKYIMARSFIKEPSKGDRLLFHLKINSLHVRGDSYPHKLIELAESLYNDISGMFSEKYGFTINEAIELYNCIKNEYEKRVNEEIISAKKIAPIITDKQISKNRKLEKEKSKLEISNFCHAFFGISDKILSFTLNDFLKITNINKSVCENFFNRLSQSFGYNNPKHLYTFSDALKSPFDYNTIYEKPILKYNEKYFVPIPSLFQTVLLNTFHYDFISDSHFKTDYDELKGKWLEKRTAKALIPIFGSINVILNPHYTNGEELADVLVLFDRKIFVIQCKSKSLTYISKIGIDFTKLKIDLEKGVKEPFEQGLKARKYLLENDSPKIIHNNIQTTIDTKQVTDVFILSVTFGYYQALLTRLSNIDSALNFFKENIYPWAVSISDFELITEIINNPYEFIHYTKQRLKTESTNYHISADEMDLLNFYLQQNLDWENKDFKESNYINLTGFSIDIDKYFFEKYELKKDVLKPTREYADGFMEFVKQIEGLDVAYKTDCIDKLLLLNKSQQIQLINSIYELKKREIKKGKQIAVNLVYPNHDFGITYFIMDSGKNINNIYKQVLPYSLLRKYEHKKKSWIGLGVDIKSQKLIDFPVYISYEWVEDPMLFKMLNQN
jgi:hypothetical protein